MSCRYHLPNRTIAACLVCLFDPLQVVHWKLVRALWVCGREGGREGGKEGKEGGKEGKEGGKEGKEGGREVIMSRLGTNVHAIELCLHT